MQSQSITKYAFRIRTRTGAIVEHLMIHGRDEQEAQHKLRLMYRDCHILECICHEGSIRLPVTSFEEVANLIVR